MLASTRLPKLSVVIPVYNAEKWLAEALGSVLEQNYPPERCEIIIVDDGSEDCSTAVARRALEGVSVSHQLVEIGRNRGPSHARNVGWKIGTGSWVQFLDADDLLHPKKMAVQAEAAASLSEEVAVVYSRWQFLDRVEQDWLEKEPVKSPMVDADPISELLKSEGFVHTGSALFRRTWLERVGGFDERYSLIEDVDLMLRIAMAGGVFYHVEADRPLFFYRRGVGSSLSQQDKCDFLEGCVRNADLVESYCRENGTLTPARVQAIASVYFMAARNLVELDRERFDQLSQKLESVSPGFRPADPVYLRWLSRLLGYRNAERLCLPVRKAFRKLSTAHLPSR
jgi:hypothetical protein